MDWQQWAPLLGLLGYAVTVWEIHSGSVSVQLFRKAGVFRKRRHEYMFDFAVHRKESPGLFWALIGAQLVVYTGILAGFLR